MPDMEYIFATHNAGKVREINAIFGEYGLTVKSLSEVGIVDEVPETGTSFTENAIQKAAGYAKMLGGAVCAGASGRAASNLNSTANNGAAANVTAPSIDTMETAAGDAATATHYAVLADDSGFSVDALGGQPGVYSSRFLGEDTPYQEKNQTIIGRLKDVPEAERTARFICVIACVLPDGRILTAEGAIEGLVAYEPRGENGFGYDPIFFLPEYGQTTAELPAEEKNRISHRGLALRAMLKQLSAHGGTPIGDTKCNTL